MEGFRLSYWLTDLGGRRLALDPRFVTAAIAVSAKAGLPGAPCPVAGLVRYGSRAMALLDLSPLLGLAPLALLAEQPALVVEAGRLAAALLVNSFGALRVMAPQAQSPGEPDWLITAQDHEGDLLMVDVPLLLRMVRPRP